MSSAQSDRISRLAARVATERGAVVLWLTLGALLRVPPALNVDLSIDETWTWVHTSELLRSDAQLKAWTIGLDAPLFVAINFAIAKLVGLSVIGLRIPSLIFGTASIALVRHLFARLVDRKSATAATAMTALSPFLVYYSLEARPYALLLFSCLTFVLAFQASVGLALWKRRVLLGLSTTFCVAAHYYAVVFLAAVYLAVLIHHVRSRAITALRRDLATGLTSLLVVSPLLILPLRRLGTISVDYWTTTSPGLMVTTFGELLWFMGLDSELAEAAIVALWAAPLVMALRRRKPVAPEPFGRYLGWLPVLFATGAGLLLGRTVLFYARGFIACLPFLFLLWVQAIGATGFRPRWLTAYVGATVAPALVMTALVTIGHPAQTYLSDRPAMREVADQVDRQVADYDLLLVHHWWLAQFLYYYTETPERVRGLAAKQDVALHDSGHEAAPVDIDSIPPEARVLLIVNRYGEDFLDPTNGDLARLRRDRPLLRVVPCSTKDPASVYLYCARMLLLGARGG